MDNVKIIKVLGTDGLETEFVIIDEGNGEFTSMPKSTYEAMQAEQANMIEAAE